MTLKLTEPAVVLRLVGPCSPTLMRLFVPASPADAVLLSRAGVRVLATGAGGAADAGVVGVDAEPGLNHHQAVMVLVTATRV